LKSVLPADDLSILSACTILKDTNAKIPVYIPQLSANAQWRSINDWPAAKSNANLIVSVSETLQKEKTLYHGTTSGTDILIQVSFYREGTVGLESAPYQCAVPFQYTSDENKLQMLVTDSLHRCLDVPFYRTARHN